MLSTTYPATAYSTATWRSTTLSTLRSLAAFRAIRTLRPIAAFRTLTALRTLSAIRPVKALRTLSAIRPVKAIGTIAATTATTAASPAWASTRLLVGKVEVNIKNMLLPVSPLRIDVLQ
jgi:hypothetical protein